MIRINLSPDPALRYDKRRLVAEAAAAIVLITMALYVPGLYAGMIREEAATLNQDTQQKQMALRKLKADSETVNQFKSAINDLKQRTAKIKNLTKGRKQPVLVLDKIQQQHPDRLWLETIELKSGIMSLSGLAAETELISEYAARIKNLNNSDGFLETDIESFVPPFKKFLEPKAEELLIAEEEPLQSILPLDLSDLNIVRSDLVTVQDVEVYRFLINFKVKMPEGI